MIIFFPLNEIGRIFTQLVLRSNFLNLQKTFETTIASIIDMRQLVHITPTELRWWLNIPLMEFDTLVLTLVVVQCFALCNVEDKQFPDRKLICLDLLMTLCASTRCDFVILDVETRQVSIISKPTMSHYKFFPDEVLYLQDIE